MNDTTNSRSDNESRISVPSPEEQLTEREHAIHLLSFLPETKSYTIYCKRTGVAIATMELLQQAGKLPYLANWHETQAYHPLFSLSQNQLLAWTRKNWNILFKSTIDHTSEIERQQFCIAFMAILHSLRCIDQTVPALPAFHTVQANMQRLLELAYWYNFLDSKRFKFPMLRISRVNANAALTDISAYLDICGSVRHDYETSKDGRAEEAKLESARKAELSVRRGHVRAVSKRALWNWFLSSMLDHNSKKYELQEWKEWKEDSAKLWFASESTQLQYSLDDVESIEEVFLTSCTLGTTVSHAFKTELNRIRNNINSHLKIFDIDWSATARQSGEDGNIQRVLPDGTIVHSAPPEPGDEPKISDFYNRVDYIRAHAKWKVAGMQWKAWNEKYGQQAASGDPVAQASSDEQGDSDE